MCRQFLKNHVLITKMALKVSTYNLSFFRHSFCSKESFWKDAWVTSGKIRGFKPLAYWKAECLCLQQPDRLERQDRLLGCGCIATRRPELLIYPAVGAPGNHPAAGSLHGCHTPAQQISAGTEKCQFRWCPERFAWARPSRKTPCTRYSTRHFHNDPMLTEATEPTIRDSDVTFNLLLYSKSKWIFFCSDFVTYDNYFF